MIERFEKEYSDLRPGNNVRIPEMQVENEPMEYDRRSRASSNASTNSIEPGGSFMGGSTSTGENFASRGHDYGSTLNPSSRRPSETNLASRALAAEEARMHRLSQRLRRDLLPPRGQEDYLHGTSTSDKPEPEHLQALRAQLEELGGEELRQRIIERGLEESMQELMADAEKLRLLQATEPEKFRKFREAQLQAERRGGFGAE